MPLLELFLQNFFSFIILISLIVFIHEFGHFYVARLCGVKIDEFSIGFGKEICGFNDKKGTRWKFCLIPLGGYVKMYGDRNGMSIPDVEGARNMTDEEKAKSFIFKNVYKRIAIVLAGPVANFILAIFIFTILFNINGVNVIPPVIGEITKDSAAYQAGLQTDDKIVTINDVAVEDFEDIRVIVSQSAEKPLNLQIIRQGQQINVTATPKSQITKDIFGDEVKVGMLGVGAKEITSKKINLGQSFVEANKETYRVSIAILKAIGELISGKRSVEELGGPIKIAKYSGKTVEMGIIAILWFVAMISVNLGVMNLLPVPVLDGGHLFYYFIEMLRGKPLPQKAQQIGYQIGLSIVLTLMLFTTFNDIRQIIVN